MDADDTNGENDTEGTPWLASNHKPVTVNFHLPDFNGANETTSAYRDNPDLICKSYARMQAHPWKPKTIAIFEPPLDYRRDDDELKDGPGIEPNYLDPKFVLDSEIMKDNGTWPQSEWVIDRPEKTNIVTIPVRKGDETCDPYDTWKWDYYYKDPIVKEDHHRHTVYPPVAARDLDAAGKEGPNPPAAAGDIVVATTPQAAGSTRYNSPFRQLFTDDLVRSDSANPNTFATPLCNDPNTVGPHYVNTVEGQFCDMTTRTLWPVCGAETIDSCFNVETMSLLGATPPQQAYPGGSVMLVAVVAPVLKQLTNLAVMM